MERRRFRPKFDRLFWIPLVFVIAVLTPMTVAAFVHPSGIVLSLATDLFCAYFFLSPAFGYVELREEALVIRFGLILRREIPYCRIRSVEAGRGFYGESILSLKNAMEHVHIRYNRFDITAVSVTDNDQLIREINQRISNLQG